MVRLVIAIALVLGLVVQATANVPSAPIADDIGCCVATGCELAADDDVAHHALVTRIAPPSEARHVFDLPIRDVEGPHLPGPFHPPRHSA
ncbi:MAG: hypothetical protein AB7P03_21895 [Kofleriaceae bacterium]